jgi:hypothetical protein
VDRVINLGRQPRRRCALDTRIGKSNNVATKADFAQLRMELTARIDFG